MKAELLRNPMKYFRLLILLAAVEVGCSKHDPDYIPYGLKGLNVYLFDEKKAPNGDYFAGYIECSYLKREEGLSNARALAYREAQRLHFETLNGRYYIICTATSESSCVTKVR